MRHLTWTEAELKPFRVDHAPLVKVMLNTICRIGLCARRATTLAGSERKIRCPASLVTHSCSRFVCHGGRLIRELGSTRFDKCRGHVISDLTNWSSETTVLHNWLACNVRLQQQEETHFFSLWDQFNTWETTTGAQSRGTGFEQELVFHV